MKKKVHKKHHGELEKMIEHQEHIYDPGYYVGGRVHPFFQSKTRIAGYAFLVMGFVLVSLPVVFYYFQLNHSVADWVGSIFFHLIPGIILLLSAFKVLKAPERRV